MHKPLRQYKIHNYMQYKRIISFYAINECYQFGKTFQQFKKLKILDE